MTLQVNNQEIKTIRIPNKQGYLPIPVRYVRLLGWEKYQVLFLIKQKDTLTITDEKTFTTIKLSEENKILKTTLTGSNNRKNLFNYRIWMGINFLNTMNYKDNTHVSLTLEDKRIIVKRFE